MVILLLMVIVLMSLQFHFVLPIGYSKVSTYMDRRE